MRKRNLMVVILAVFMVATGCGVSKEEFEQKVGELETAKKENIKLEDLLKAKDANIAELEKKSKETLEKVELLQKENAAAKKHQAELLEENSEKTSQLENAQRSLDNLENRIADLSGVLTQNDNSLASLQKKLRDLTGKLGLAQSLAESKSEELEKVRGLLSNLNIEKGSLEKKLTENVQSIAQLQGLLTQKDHQISSKAAALKQKDDQIQSLIKQLDVLKKGGSPGLGGLKGFMK